MIKTEGDAALYAALLAKDSRFDGRFFVGVSSTGIYCRPICRARPPKPENCTFFSTAAEAEQAGYRPCLLCRPELAPGSAPVDAAPALARKAAGLLEECCGSGLSLPELARQLGCTDRHLRRVFLAEYHVTPVQYLQTCRLLLAKGLLTDTGLSVLEVAMAAGFGSLRRMNDLFRKSYRLSPTALRKRAARGEGCSREVTAALGFRPPYRWEELLAFLQLRAIPGVERVEDGCYFRTVCLTGRKGERCAGWIRVAPHPRENRLEVTLSDTLVPVLSQVLSRVRRLFDLACDPETVYDTLRVMDRLRPGLAVPGRRVPGSFEPFETAVRAVLGQQITVKAASTLAGRLTAALGTPIETGIPGLTHVFPAPEELLALGDELGERLGQLGIISARASAIREMGEAMVRGELHLSPGADVEAETAALQRIKGIGSWTAQYLAMRTMAWPDAFLETDAGVRHALPGYTPRELLELAEAWRPWRSYAVMNLWSDLGKPKEEA